MKWKDVKFWLWLEIDFPPEETEEEENELPLSLAPKADRGARGRFGAGDSGSLSGVEVYEGDCGPEPVPGETVCFDLLNYSHDYELNAIPTATCGVAIGRRADDVNVAAEIHNYIDRLQIQLPARVWCMADTLAASELEEGVRLWPEGEFIIFEGKVTGSGFRRNQGGAELNLALTHWLADLNASSAVSRQSHPLNPSQLYFPANFVLDEELSGGSFLSAVGPGQSSASLAMPFFANPTILATDFWGGMYESSPHVAAGLKDWLLYLTRQDRLNEFEIRNLTSGAATSLFAPQKNWEACRAISRFEPNSRGPDWQESGYVLGVPLSLVDVTTLETSVANAIGEEIGSESLEAYSNTTLWDKLSGQLHANYLFSIVPLTRKALCVPFVPGLANLEDTVVHRILRTTHYESLDLSAVMPRPLRALGLFVGMQNVSGDGFSGDRQATYQTMGGWFDKMSASPDSRYASGLILFKQAPKWLSTFNQDYIRAQSSTGGANDTVRTPVDPAAGDPSVEDPPNVILSNAKPIWDKYAQSLYMHEILKNRQGSINGPVRFDIAPGSTLKVEMTEDKWVRYLLRSVPVEGDIRICDDEFYTYFYCSVLRVSTTIDCQNSRAFTSFYVAHVRSQSENEDPGTSIEAHPLWSRCKWGGCTMVEDAAFAPQTTRECDPEE